LARDVDFSQLDALADALWGATEVAAYSVQAMPARKRCSSLAA
jgi:hypothetical protein